MKLRVLLSETWRNLECSGRSLVAALALAAATCGAADLEMTSAASLMAQSRHFEQAGASTYLISAPRSVAGQVCEGLLSSGDIEASGALRAEGHVSLAVLPDQSLPVFAASPGLLRLLGVERTAASTGTVAVAEQVWESIFPTVGWPSDGTSYELPPLSISGSFAWPSDGRSSTLGFAVLSPTPPTGVYDQCWVRSSDPERDPRWLLSNVLLPGTNPSEVRTIQLNPTLGQHLESRAEFARRPSGLAFLPVGSFAAFLAAIAMFLRRVEVAGQREVGLTAGSAALMYTLESGLWWAASTLVSAPIVLWRAHVLDRSAEGDLAALALPLVASGYVGALLGTIVTTLLIRRKSVEVYLRDR